MSEKYEVGSIVEGKVIKIKPFGAIISLENGTQGLVHISQIANSFVQNISDHLNIGDVVKVKVLSVDEATNKISLSIRDALPPVPKQRPQQNYNRNRDQSYNENKNYKSGNDYQSSSSSSSSPTTDFEDKMKEWLKQSNERQAGLNKRNNKRN